ncbi:MAG: adenylate/guanylate cyclase domain-containing protein [Pseudomonadota bacterium]
MKRRLTTILAADVVGYSRLMRADETATFERVGHTIASLIVPRLEARSGRVFKTMGDGLLAEFTSVRLAVVAALEIQEALATDPVADAAGPNPIRLRIGITMGDVIAQDGDLYGDGVNMAARVESIAPVGGVAVTRAVRDAVRDHMDLVFQDAGKKVVKNIPRPVHIFHVKRPVAGAAETPSAAVTIPAPDPGVMAQTVPPARARRPILVPAIAAGALVLLAGAAFHDRGAGRLDQATTPEAASEAQASLGVEPLADGTVPSADAAASFETVAVQEPAEADLAPAADNVLSLAELSDGEALAALPWKPQGVEGEEQGASAGTFEPETVGVRISFSLNPGSWSTCVSFGGETVHRLPIGEGADWQTIRTASGPELEMRARAVEAGDGEGVTVTILPYPGTWRSSDELTVHFDERTPGAVRDAFSQRRARPPFIGCGRLVAHVKLVD